MESSFIPFAVDKIPQQAIQLEEGKDGKWDATVRSAPHRLGHHFSVVDIEDPTTAVAKVRSLITQILTQPGSLKFEDCCCSRMRMFVFPVVIMNSDHPNWGFRTNPGRSTEGVRVYQCRGCGTCYTQAYYHQDGSSADDFSIWHTWPSSAEIGISYDEKRRIFTFNGREIHCRHMKMQFPND